MELPVLSVIIPVYNVEKYLDECVNSIVNQSYKNLEIILQSNEGLENFIELLQSDNEFIRYIALAHQSPLESFTRK